MKKIDPNNTLQTGPKRISVGKLIKFAAIIFLLIPGHRLHAATSTYYWDTNGSTTGLGGSGTWDASTTSDWSTSGTGNVATTTWTNTSDLAIFKGTAGTVTVSGSVNVGQISFQSAGYTLTGGTITYAGSDAFIVLATTNNSGTATVINSTLNLGSSSNYIRIGVKQQVPGSTGASNAGQLLTIAGNIVGGGGTTGTSSQNVSLETGNSGAVTNGTASNVITVTGTIQNGSKNTVGVSTGGIGTVILTASNSYTGLTTINKGTTIAANNNAFGNATTAIVIGDTTKTYTDDNIALLLSGNVTLNRSISIVGRNTINTSGSTASVTGSTTLGGDSATGNAVFSGSVTWAAAVDGTLSLTAAAGNSVTFSGAISESTNKAAIQKVGAGVVSLSSSNGNTYRGGTIVKTGTLLANNKTGSAFGTGALSVASGATIGGTGQIQLTTGAFTINGNVLVGSGTDTTSGLTLSSTVASSFDGASLEFNLDSTGGSNVLNIGSTAVSFTNTTLVVTLLGTDSIDYGTEYLLIDGTTGSSYSNLTTFTNALGQQQISSGLSLAFTGATAQSKYASSYLYINGDDIELQVVPEPSTWALVAPGVGLLWLLRRKRF
ncbi:MAG: autotransporter-associated beta strand repeat-containing protein [Chthoniobacteraceae bacterium]